MKCIACGKNKLNIESFCLDCEIIYKLLFIKYFHVADNICILCNQPLLESENYKYCETCMKKYRIHNEELNIMKYSHKYKYKPYYKYMVG